MIIFSDLHLDVDSADVCLGQILPAICDAAKNSDKRVVFLGDWWHLRYRVVVKLQLAVWDELRRWGHEGVILEIIPGNHDQINLQGRNALEVFNDLTNVNVYTEPYWNERVVVHTTGSERWRYLWLPYRKDPQEYVASLVAWRKVRGNAPGIVFAHQAIAGAWMNDNHQNLKGPGWDLFQPDESVFLGHFHKRQRIGSGFCWYVGSPRQVTAHEAGQPKGYCVVEGEPGKFDVTWVDTKWGPRFHKFELAEGAVLDLSDVSPGDDLRVEVANDTECGRVARVLDDLDVKHTVTPKVKSAKVRAAVEVDAELRDFAAEYVREYHDELDPASLMTLFDELQGADSASAIGSIG